MPRRPVVGRVPELSNATRAPADARDDARQGATARLSTLAVEIDAAHRATCVAAEVHYAEARRAGRLLIEAKALVAHGEWGGWVRENFKGSATTARNYMRLAREPEPENSSAADISIRAALAQAQRRRERLRKEAGPKPGEHVSAMCGPYPDLPAREASDLIRAKQGLPPLPPTRREQARSQLDEMDFPAAGTEREVVFTEADGQGGRARRVIREGDPEAGAVFEAIDRARGEQPCR